MHTLSAPVTVHNLTAWFILAPSPEPNTSERDYSVLEESIEAETALLHETGDVNELLIENTGDLDLFIQAGDIVKGGRQDRTIGADFIVPARSGQIPLPTYCVEQSRWHRRNFESDTHFSTSRDFLASKKARLALRLAKDQGEVWESVAAEQASLSSALDAQVQSDESPTSLQLTYESEGVQHAIEDYTSSLEQALAAAGGTAVGVVWAINGEPSHADRYLNPRLFTKLWRKLLRAAATEAIAHRRSAHGEGSGNEQPTPAAIEAWLAGKSRGRRAKPEEEQLPPRTLLRTRRGKTRHCFEAFDTALEAETPIHVAILTG